MSSPEEEDSGLTRQADRGRLPSESYDGESQEGFSPGEADKSQAVASTADDVAPTVPESGSASTGTGQQEAAAGGGSNDKPAAGSHTKTSTGGFDELKDEARAMGVSEREINMAYDEDDLRSAMEIEELHKKVEQEKSAQVQADARVVERVEEPLYIRPQEGSVLEVAAELSAMAPTERAVALGAMGLVRQVEVA